MGKLFENFKLIDTNEELEKLKRQHPQYDPAYITLVAGKSRQHLKEWLEELWRQYEPYADKDFPEKIKKEFHQRAWEMYLACTLLNRGFSLQERKNRGPDICLLIGDRIIWIEAVTPSVGKGKDKVPEIRYGIAQEVPEAQILLRLTSALRSKAEKYKEYLHKNFIKEDEPYIIAINRGAIPHPDPQIPLILKCLFSIGFEKIHIRGEKPTEHYWSKREELIKRSGSSVSMGFFENPEHRGVSAVIYCKDSILNSPQDRSEMGNNFVLVLNPLAKNPIQEQLFKFGKVYKKTDNEIVNLNKE
jgi:type I restriction enzyme S subunit